MLCPAALRRAVGRFPRGPVQRWSWQCRRLWGQSHRGTLGVRASGVRPLAAGMVAHGHARVWLLAAWFSLWCLPTRDPVLGLLASSGDQNQWSPAAHGVGVESSFEPSAGLRV